MSNNIRFLLMPGLLLSLAVFASGCGNPSPAPTGTANSSSAPNAKEKSSPHAEAGHEHDGHDHDGHDHDEGTGDTAHSGWWCDEHGIPEAVCSMCSPKVALQFQKKGDWCEEHDRAKSQCFVCDPGLKEKFAKQYRAKYGKEPPAIEDHE
ncbi:MAG: hypothetical protein NT069_14300 [Planctomycetota bacterium]|nr:hypothetical protein [Planctomycetota bacterium]